MISFAFPTDAQGVEALTDVMAQLTSGSPDKAALELDAYCLLGVAAAHGGSLLGITPAPAATANAHANAKSLIQTALANPSAINWPGLFGKLWPILSGIIGGLLGGGSTTTGS